MSRSIVNVLCFLALLASAFANQLAPAQAAARVFPAQSGPAAPLELGAFIDEVMASEMSANPFPGAAITVVKDGQVLFQKGYGYADLENQVPVDPALTIFRIGSTTKLFTWTAVMQLVEKGKLDLDADINTYLDFKIPSTYPQPITLKNLMSHTAGFEDQNDGHFKIRAEDVAPLGQYLKTHIPGRVFPPGKLVAYSNYGAALAGYIVERVSAMPFAEYVEQNIFAPLNMSRSTLRQPVPAGLAPNLSKGYVSAQGNNVSAGFEFMLDYPAGSLSSTAADMAQFMLAHLQDGQGSGARILSEETARQMHSQLFTPDPRLPGMAYGFFETSLNGQRILSHAGDTRLFHSNLWLLPDQNAGIFIATNGSGGAAIATMLIYQIVERFYPAASTPTPASTPGFAARVAPYLGTYYSARCNFTTFEKLMCAMPSFVLSQSAPDSVTLGVMGQSLPLVEAGPGLLRDPNDADTQLVLHTDEAGQAYLLTSDPWAYIKVPWYGTTEFRNLLSGIGLVLFMGSIAAWGIVAIIGLRKRKSFSLVPGLARGTGALFGLLFAVFFAGLYSLLSAVDPVYGYPILLLEKPLTFNILMALPYVLAALGLLMLAFTLLSWFRRYWTLFARLHYTLLTLLGFSLLWLLGYWNLLL